MAKLTKFKEQKVEFPTHYLIENTTRGNNNIKSIVPEFGVIKEQGTLETAEVYNGLQLGNVHTLYATKTTALSIDYYTADIEGLNEFGLNNDLKIYLIADSTNENDSPKLRLNGVDYALLKEYDGELKNVFAKDIKPHRANILHYNGSQFIVSNIIVTATEEKHGIAKLYSSTETETDSDRVKEIIEKNTGNNEESGKTKWTKLIETLDHTKILTVQGLVKFLSKLLKPAGEKDYGLINYETIKQVSPKPDLTPYIPFNKGYRNNTNTDWVLRSNKSETWMPSQAHMYGGTGDYTGTFHTNGGRAYYKVPNRNGGNWCEIMDNFDMASRDSNIQHAHARITDTWNYAVNANGRFNWSNVYNSNNYIAPGGSIAAVPANWNEIVIYYRVGSDNMRGTVTFVKGGHAFVHNNGGLHIELRGTVIHSVGANTGTVMQVWVRV